MAMASSVALASGVASWLVNAAVGLSRESPPMVTEAAQVAGFSQYGQRDDGTNAGQLAKPRSIGVVG